MVAILSVLKTAQYKRVHCKQGADQAAPQNVDPMFSLPWPWDQCDEDQQPTTNSCSGTPAAPCVSVSRPSASVAQNKLQLPYALSSHPADSHTGRRSTISSSTYVSSSTQSRTTGVSTVLSSASPITSSTLWVEDTDAEDATPKLPRVHPSDHVKTLLTQLASWISSTTTANAHQQAAALFSQSAPPAIGEDSVIVLSGTEKDMVEVLQILSRLLSQLAPIPHRPKPKDGDDVTKEDPAMRLQLKCYEGIIARFHDEICRKNAVTEALKETLAKSILKGEKLQQRVNALEAQLTMMPCTPAYDLFGW